MSRKIKNIIFIALIILSIIMISLTLNYAKKHLTSEISDVSINENFRNGMHTSDDEEIDKGIEFNGENSDLKGGIKGKGNKQIDESEIPDEIKEQFENGDSSNIKNGARGGMQGKGAMAGETGTTGDADFMADGNFAGAGETINSEAQEITLTVPYIVFIGVWSLVLSISLVYLIMSNFSSKKVFESAKKVIIFLLCIIVITGALTTGTTAFANNVFLNNGTSSNTLVYSSTDDLHIDMSAWNYDETNNVYWQIGLVYVSNPKTVEYESLGIYVPGDYMTGKKNSDGTYTCTINASKTVGNYTAETAPIVFPVNTGGYAAQAAPTSYSYSGLSEYLDAGFIYVYAGCRGKSNGTDYAGGAPWGVTDLKAAIRYIRYNSEELPGDSDSVFVFGMSGGGAQSALLGATGDSELYTPYLESIGAIMTDDNGNTISDSVTGTMAWCPITSLDYANEAYEWNMGQYTDLRNS
jgi:hypothetical protein